MIQILNSWTLTPPPELIILIYNFGLYIYHAALPNYSYYLSCRYLNGDNCTFTLSKTKFYCNLNNTVDQIEAYSSYLLLLSQVLYSSLAIPAIFITGPLSDLLGRKVIILTALFASIISLMCFCMIDIFSLHPFFILLPSIIDGIFGNRSVIYLGIVAMCLDISSEKYRTLRMGIFESAFIIGALASNLLSGLIIDSMGFLGCFAFIVFIWSLILCYTRYIPETLHQKQTEKDITFDIKYLLAKSLTPLRLFKHNKNRYRFIVFVVAYIFFIEDIASNRSIFALYVLAPPICWGPIYQGYYFGLRNFSMTIGIYIVLPLLILCGVPDLALLLIGAIDNAIAFGIIGVSSSTWWLLGVVPVSGFLTSLGVPSIRSGLSKLVVSTEQGSMLTIIEIVNCISTVFSTLFFNALYPTLRKINASYCFFIISATSVIPCCVVLLLMIYEYYKKRRLKGIAYEENRSLLQHNTAIN
ncbi:Proton-coupled folate transporter-like [Oopsacas minuta]|uniref:Proton-coupled folate transporter-like n=1 Tax=Oopsacas minuta TaxID=111878 RepID=A0AAV7K676_9METZ|nr:Proton-coupled folate transporter-like [Oopsacas minuta]